jgi:hypothetical protein
MSEMGTWKLSGEATRCIVISSGVVAVESKDEDAVQDFSLRYWGIKQMLENEPLAKEYHMTKTSYMGLIRCVKEGKLDQLGYVFEETRTISVTDEDKKRDYALTPYTVLPKNGGDLLKRKWKSKPRDISLVMAQDIEVSSEENNEGETE